MAAAISGDSTLLIQGTAGTAARFLLAALAASPGAAIMDGTPRMREVFSGISRRVRTATSDTSRSKSTKPS